MESGIKLRLGGGEQACAHNRPDWGQSSPEEGDLRPVLVERGTPVLRSMIGTDTRKHSVSSGRGDAP
jgi:hypothetical protein